MTSEQSDYQKKPVKKVITKHAYLSELLVLLTQYESVHKGQYVKDDIISMLNAALAFYGHPTMNPESR